MREKRHLLIQQINSIFKKFGSIKDTDFDTAIKIALKISGDVLEHGENRDTIRDQCNSVLQNKFYFKIEKLRDELSIEKKFNYVFITTNKQVGEHQEARDNEGDLADTHYVKFRKNFRTQVVHAILKQGQIHMKIGNPSFETIGFDNDRKKTEIEQYKEEFLETGLLHEYVDEHGVSSWRLTSRAVIELDDEIRKYFDKNKITADCFSCRSLLVDGTSCVNEKCTARYHRSCAMNLIAQAQKHRAKDMCLKCKSEINPVKNPCPKRN